MHIIHYKAEPQQVEGFECVVQKAAHCLYKLKLGITDVRICHPCCGEVCFVLTFLSVRDLEQFKAGESICSQLAVKCPKSQSIHFAAKLCTIRR